MSISDAENESGNDKNDASDKEEIEENPEKHTKNTKYTKEDFIARKHGSEKEPWVQKQRFPIKGRFLMRKFPLCLITILLMARFQRNLEI